MEPEAVAPAGVEFCAGVPQSLTSVGCENAASVLWIAVATPFGVNPDDVIFTTPQQLSTDVIVPVSGLGYAFAIKCCEVAPQ